MKHLILSFSILLAVGFSSTVTADELQLPGSTLGGASSEGLQPVANPENIVGDAISPECPFIGQTYQQLLRFARANYINIYLQALSLRRGGASQAVVRSFLENAICVQEGY